MPPRKSAKPLKSVAAAAAAAAAAVTTPEPAASSSPAASTPAENTAAIVMQAYKSYVDGTPKRMKLLDCFLAFLVAVGGLQFVYCVLVGNYPFNAFLSGFAMTIGQFVLAVSLRIQTNPANSSQFEKVSPERAFADFVFGSLVLHFFVYNFIN
ncbi:DAD family-domain-containing protein [Limtongia smithiae]|uniref:DAD family-domain-containing protein n=1 Tax=Limtongia smithiae TaxID=1125753 RepID=UPI0034CEB59F